MGKLFGLLNRAYEEDGESDTPGEGEMKRKKKKNKKAGPSLSSAKAGTTEDTSVALMASLSSDATKAFLTEDTTEDTPEMRCDVPPELSATAQRILAQLPSFPGGIDPVGLDRQEIRDLCHKTYGVINQALSELLRSGLAETKQVTTAGAPKAVFWATSNGTWSFAETTNYDVKITPGTSINLSETVTTYEDTGALVSHLQAMESDANLLMERIDASLRAAREAFEISVRLDELRRGLEEASTRQQAIVEKWGNGGANDNSDA